MTTKLPDTSEQWIVKCPFGTYYASAHDLALKYARCTLKQWPSAKITITHEVTIRSAVAVPVIKPTQTKAAKAKANRAKAKALKEAADEI